MKLKTIALSIYGHPQALGVPFSFETRSLCNYVQRHARFLKIETNGFNQIVIQDNPHDAAILTPRVVPEKTLAVPFQFDASRYQQSPPNRKQEYFAEILAAGLQRAHEFHPLPIDELLQKIDEFRESGHRNCWIHQTKNIRSAGIVAELQCELTMDAFMLTLDVRGKNGASKKIPILSTKPDELCFHHQFKDIEVREGHLVITNRKYSNDELVRFELSSLAALGA